MIEIKNVSKKFRLQRDSNIFSLKNIINHLLEKRKLKEKNTFFWALQDVSFSVKEGQRLGIIGDNGSGKTTLMKIIAGVSKQTDGIVNVTQRPMILETKFGMKENLTARENIYTKACLLGMSEKYIDSIIDEVIEFAELGEHADQPVKYLSSGMGARLGFSLTRYVDSDLILMDETFSRGDIHFAQKTSNIFTKWVKEGKTFIVISHNLQNIEEICTHCLYLKKGRVEAFGSPKDVIAEYKKDIREEKGVEDIPDFDR